MRLLCLAFVLAGAGCVDHAEPAVQVRLARSGEFPAQLASPLGPWEGCSVEGANDRELYGAVIEYARRELVARAPIQVHFEGDPHGEGACTVIDVDPRSKVGRLSVAHPWGGRDDYCVHVVSERGKTVLALALRWSIER